jgi:hypothetical protein
LSKFESVEEVSEDGDIWEYDEEWHKSDYDDEDDKDIIEY